MQTLNLGGSLNFLRRSTQSMNVGAVCCAEKSCATFAIIITSISRENIRARCAPPFIHAAIHSWCTPDPSIRIRVSEHWQITSIVCPFPNFDVTLDPAWFHRAFHTWTLTFVLISLGCVWLMDSEDQGCRKKTVEIIAL